MTPGIFAKTFPGETPEAVLARIAEAGFGAAQYNLACSGLPAMPNAMPDGAAEAVAAAAYRTGVALAALSGTYNMIHPDPAEREAGLVRLEVVAAAAAAMGAPVVTLCTGTRDAADKWRAHPDNARPEAWRDLTAEMEKAIRIAERHAIRLGIEPEPANVVTDPAAAARLLAEMGSDRLGIVLDPANLFETGGPELVAPRVADAVDRLAGHILLAHAKDRAPDGRVVPAGHGSVDFPDFLARLKGAGFDGAVIAHGIAAEEAPAVARFLAERIAAA